MIAMRSPMLVHYPPAQLAVALFLLTLGPAIAQVPDHAPLLGVATASLFAARWVLAGVLATTTAPARSVRDVLWLLPLLEASMLVGFAQALVRPRVNWRGRELRVGPGGRVVAE